MQAFPLTRRRIWRPDQDDFREAPFEAGLLSLGCRFLDLTVTATSVVSGAGAVVETLQAGETITAGQTLYVDATDGKAYKSDANGAAAAKALKGVALNGGSVNQRISIQKEGTITIGATVVVGTLYVVSATAGGIAPAADLASGMDTIVVGVGSTTGAILMNIWDTGIAVP